MADLYRDWQPSSHNAGLVIALECCGTEDKVYEKLVKWHSLYFATDCDMDVITRDNEH